jgi:hypothetical protein
MRRARTNAPSHGARVAGPRRLGLLSDAVSSHDDKRINAIKRF